MFGSFVLICALGGLPWQWIVTAPKTGAVIEVEDRFGLLSERSLQRWDGSKWVQIAPPAAGRSSLPSSLDDRPCLYWRPFNGVAAQYDPHTPSDADKIAAMRTPRKLSACTTQDAAPSP